MPRAMLSILVVGQTLVGSSSLLAAEAAPIDPGVFKRYTRDQFPNAFRIYGETTIRGLIQDMREGVAAHAARQPGCLRVEYAELSGQKSTVKKPVTFADCANGDRYYMDRTGKTWAD